MFGLPHAVSIFEKALLKVDIDFHGSSLIQVSLAKI